jgi:hypothetical protein
MTMDEFRASVAAASPPQGLGDALQALWWDAKGDWGQAHGCAQQDEAQTGSGVHAYLHRKEGDLSNAAYWYKRAGRAMPSDSLEAEWDRLARELLAH